jgi:hypothetical protein
MTTSRNHSLECQHVNGVVAITPACRNYVIVRIINHVTELTRKTEVDNLANGGEKVVQ